MEVWKDVPQFGGVIQASSDGRIRMMPRKLRFVSKRGTEAWRVTQMRELPLNRINSGYDIVHFRIDGRRFAELVHGLVAAAFIGPRPEGMDINHLDGVKTNNHAYNLEYVTRTENHKHAVRVGLNKQAKPVESIDFYGDPRRYPSITEAARSVGVTYGSIAYALRKGTWCQGCTWRFA